MYVFTDKMLYGLKYTNKNELVYFYVWKIKQDQYIITLTDLGLKTLLKYNNTTLEEIELCNSLEKVI